MFCSLKLGNDNYRRLNYKEASKKYRKAIYLLDNTSVNSEEDECQWKHVMLKLNLNMSQICLKQVKPKKTIFYCKEALDIDKDNVKALFRYGQVHNFFYWFLTYIQIQLTHARKSYLKNPDSVGFNIFFSLSKYSNICKFQLAKKTFSSFHKVFKITVNT